MSSRMAFRLGLSAMRSAISSRALAIDRRQEFPRRPRLKAPFDEMQQENREAADEFALLGLAHALDFLGDRGEVRFRDPAGAQERRLFEAPGVEVAVVQGSSRRHLA